MATNVVVGRMDNLKPVRVSDTATVEDAFNKANITLAASEKIETLDGDEVDFDDTVEAGLTYLAIKSVKSGNY